MKFHLYLPAIFVFALTFSGCDSATDPAVPGTHQVFVSNNPTNQRIKMNVTEDTTFADVKTFATTELNLAGQDFELRVAGKTPAPTDKLSDHGITLPNQPLSIPVGNILVKIKN